MRTSSCSTASIDRVVLVHALEETESPDDLIEEVGRVLSPGGRMILVVPNRRGLSVLLHVESEVRRSEADENEHDDEHQRLGMQQQANQR